MFLTALLIASFIFKFIHHSCSAGQLRLFRNALHPSRSFAGAIMVPHDCHPISFRSLSTLLLQVIGGLPSGTQVSAVLAMLLLCLCRTCPIHLHLCHNDIFNDSGSFLLTCTAPHLRFGLARKLSVFPSGISCETHPGCSCLQL